MTRKELVQALEVKLGAKAKYLRVPSCAYEINCSAGTFRIDRQGVIKDTAGRELSAEELLHKPEVEPEAEPDEDTASVAPEEFHISEYVVELPMAGHTAASLRNLVNMLASKQHLLISAFGLKQPLLVNHVAEKLSKRNSEDMAAFQAAWVEVGSGCRQGLEIDFAKQTLAMKLAKDNPTQDEMAAFVELTACINEQAKKLKHSSFKPAQDDNPKYAFRTWLLRLGMNGDAFKKTRKTLLARLSGNAAFRTSEEEEKHKVRLLVRKEKLGEGDGDVC